MLTGLGGAMFAPTASGAGVLLVPPHRRGFALSTIIGGLTVATALGSPMGSVIGALGDWRWTMIFVSGLGSLAFLGVVVFLSDIPTATRARPRKTPGTVAGLPRCPNVDDNLAFDGRLLHRLHVLLSRL